MFLAATLDSAQSYSQFQGSLRQTPSAKGMKMDRMPKAARNQQYHREPRMLAALMVVPLVTVALHREEATRSCAP